MKKNGFWILVIAALLIGFLSGVFVGRSHVKDGIQVIMDQPEDVGKVNINTATFDELLLIPGIGETMAQRIIDYRARKGGFASVEDLLNVSGISPQKLEQIRPMLIVE